LRFEVRHSTRYTYTQPVYLERHLIRLRPVSNVSQRLLEFEMQIDPAPAVSSPLVDLDGNEAMAAWFNSMTDYLEIEAASQVETLRANPFDYLWEGPGTLPLTYSPALAPALAPYLESSTDPAVATLSDELASEAGGNAQAFLSALTQALNTRLEYTIRPEGLPRAPAETLHRGEGTCRDLSVLFMALARHQGIAARFVSGYHAQAGAEDGFELHAWPEIYAPAGGWRGYDPTTGMAVADRHIVIAVGVLPEQATPVEGSIRGGAKGTLETKVEIRAL